MNDDRLSPREHSEMRDILLAGTQRIKPAGARRTQMIAASIALVLVAGVTGGAIATAAIFGSEAIPPVATPTPTLTSPDPTPTTEPTPTSTPTPDPPAPPAEGVVAFGGSCANILTDGEVDALRGVDMMLSDYRWLDGGDAVVGGIDCVWVSAEEYLSAVVHVYAFPEATAPSWAIDMYAPGCTDLGGDFPRVQCTTTEVIDGTWLLVTATAAADLITGSGVDALFSAAAARLPSYPAPVPATPTAQWWAPMGCAAIVAQIDPAIYGFERVALLDGLPTSPSMVCELHFTSGSGDNTSGEVVSIRIVPGGAITFPTALAAEGATPVTVTGAQSAVIAPGLDRYEGSGQIIVATDGVNTLLVTPDYIRETAAALPIADVVFAQLHP